MTDAAPGKPTYPLHALFRDRCRALGLPSWRCDTSGIILDEPTETGPAGIWLRSSMMARTVALAAVEWAREPKPGVIQPFDGCWLIPVQEFSRRRCVGYTIALALGPAALQSDRFRQICQNVGVDPQAVRRTLSRQAAFESSTVASLALALEWTMRDLALLDEHQRAVDGFTTQLTDAYETIDVVYTLGRSMRDAARPDRFVQLVCERLHESLPFGWVMATFVPDKERADGLAGLSFSAGAPSEGVDLGSIGSAMRGAFGDLRAVRIVGDEAKIPAALPSQILAQPIVREGRTAGLLLAGEKHGPDMQVSSYDTKLFEVAASYVEAFLSNAALFERQREMLMGSLKAMTAAIDAKDRYTRGHSERVALIASQLAMLVGFDREKAERVRISGLLHDVGKIGVPERVLCKPGRLTDEEFGLIKLHPEIGHGILKDIPQLEDVLPGVLHHHERWDGKGYPRGLSGEQIPLIARLLGLADTFDAMSSTRSYRQAMPREKVLGEIARCAGTQFDPMLANAFSRMDLREYDEMYARQASDLAEPPAQAA